MQLNTARRQLARKVRNFRAERQLTQTELSNRASIGVSRRTLQRLENSDVVAYNPKLSTLLKLAHGLNTDVSTLIGQISRQTTAAEQ